MHFEIEKLITPKNRTRSCKGRPFRVQRMQSAEFRNFESMRHRHVHDHIGHEFRSLKEMCAFWGVEYATFKYRREKGTSLEFALTSKKYKYTKACHV